MRAAVGLTKWPKDNGGGRLFVPNAAAPKCLASGIRDDDGACVYVSGYVHICMYALSI